MLAPGHKGRGGGETHAEFKVAELLLCTGSVKCPVAFTAQLALRQPSQHILLCFPDWRPHFRPNLGFPDSPNLPGLSPSSHAISHMIDPDCPVAAPQLRSQIDNTLRNTARVRSLTSKLSFKSVQEACLVVCLDLGPTSVLVGFPLFPRPARKKDKHQFMTWVPGRDQRHKNGRLTPSCFSYHYQYYRLVPAS